MRGTIGTILALVFAYLCLTCIKCDEDTGLTDVESLDVTFQTLLDMYKKKSDTEPAGKFYTTVFAVMKAVAEAHASSQTKKNKKLDVNLLKDHLRWATKNRNFLGVTEQIGKTLVAFFDITSKTISSEENKSVKNEEKEKEKVEVDEVALMAEAAQVFLGALADDIGEEIYDQLIVREGDSSLIFVIDATGSMANEIRTAREITKSIIREKRNGNVSYILTTFRDPYVDAPVFMPPEKKVDFIRKIGRILPAGGGDCPEMAFSAIIASLNAGAQYGSQMIVITDASAKDDTEDNLEMAKESAIALGITVSFFTALSGCNSSDHAIDAFRSLAAATNGLVFALKNDQEMMQLTSYVSDSLRSRQLLENNRGDLNQNKNEKDDVKEEYETRPFKVDDTVEVLDVSITAKDGRKKAEHIYLKRPDGAIVKPTVVLTQSNLYKIKNPQAGEWKLLISGDVGSHTLLATGTGRKTIEFDYYFIFGGGTIAKPIEHPLLGKETIMRVLVGGAQNVQPDSMYLELLDLDGNMVQNYIDMLPIGKTDVQYEAYINIPTNTSFKVQLRGNTMNDVPFLRLSKKIEIPKPAYIQVLYARRDFTIRQGKTTFIVLEIRNFGQRETYRVSVVSKDGDARLTRDKIMLRKDTSGFTGIRFKAKPGMVVGQAAVIGVKAVGVETNTMVYSTVRLLVVPIQKKSMRRRRRNYKKNSKGTV